MNGDAIKNYSISVIMPVYNAEKYLSKAIECVLSQNYKNIELILVNDCSTDQSGIICDKYASLDSRVTVLHLEQNGGAGNARNKGIELAKGEYVTFVDSDDEISLNLYEKVSGIISSHHCDVVVWGVIEEYFDKKDELISENRIIFPETDCKNRTKVQEAALLLEEKTLLGYQWNKVYKKALLNNNGIRFEDAILYEDYFFNTEVMKHTESMYILNDALYHYKKRMNDSITSRFVPEYFKLSHRRVKTMYDLCIQWQIEKEVINKILGKIYLRYILSALMRNCDTRSNKDYKQQKQWIKKVAEEDLYQNLGRNGDVQSVPLRFLQRAVNLKLYGVCVIMGNIVYFVKKCTPIVFSLIKQNK